MYKIFYVPFQMPAEPPKVLDTLRLVSALENLLGSLAPQITAILSRALALDKKRAGSNGLILEDANVAGILELTKEKLAGQIVAGMYRCLPKNIRDIYHCLEQPDNSKHL